jgi:hypothetical protein
LSFAIRHAKHALVERTNADNEQAIYASSRYARCFVNAAAHAAVTPPTVTNARRWRE